MQKCGWNNFSISHVRITCSWATISKYSSLLKNSSRSIVRKKKRQYYQMWERRKTRCLNSQLKGKKLRYSRKIQKQRDAQEFLVYTRIERREWDAYLFPPSWSLRMISKLPNQGRIMYLTYSIQGFSSTTFGGQNAFLIFRLTSIFKRCTNKTQRDSFKALECYWMNNTMYKISSKQTSSSSIYMAELGSLFDIFPCPVSPQSMSCFCQGSGKGRKGYPIQ